MSVTHSDSTSCTLLAPSSPDWLPHDLVPRWTKC